MQKRNCQNTEASTSQKFKADNRPDQSPLTNPILATNLKSPSKLTKTKADADSGSALARLANHRATSFATVTCGNSDSRQPFRRVKSTSSNVAQTSFMGATSSSTVSSESRMFFTGYTFRAFGEANGSTLRTAVEQHGGMWLEDSSDETEANFLLVRLARYVDWRHLGTFLTY